MIASILDTATLAKVILYSLIAGVGVTVVFALAVSSAAGLVDAIRERRTLAGALWGATAALCLMACVGAIVLGVVVMASKR
ncbi:MAG TPA: hypothetical protein VG388_08210 [Solirubrobacteraceae bacterium]|nr:hypothetical protein [Solirubrobacteraceae bacterium]